VRSVGKDGVGLSTEPGFYQPFIQDIPRNEILYVVDGPQRVDAIWWWKLRSAQGVEGWGNQDNITPDPGPCALVAPIAIGIATVPAVAATPASHLPQTGGGGNAVWFFAGLLLVVLIVSGVLRRRFQTETHSDSHLPD
jgi:LPXTG-motif cell wall-anchored protein